MLSQGAVQPEQNDQDTESPHGEKRDGSRDQVRLQSGVEVLVLVRRVV